jgi:folate-binding protein YgfZ
MSHNPQPASAQEFRLPHAVLAIAGRDAMAFAQAQFMNDVAALADGRWQWNGWLTPKGRVIALFALLRLDAETLWLVLPDAEAPELAAKLQRYVFRSKVQLTAPALACAGAFRAPLRATGNRFAAGDDGTVELDMGGAGGARRLVIGGEPAADDADVLVRWDADDLAHGLPRLRGDQVEAWTPQQLSLDRLAAFSVKKGCYPGQEIVARTHFLGQAKRGLALFHIDAPVSEGSAIESGDRGIGTLVAVRGDLALGVVPLEAPEGARHAGGIPLTAQPLLAGLERRA